MVLSKVGDGIAVNSHSVVTYFGFRYFQQIGQVPVNCVSINDDAVLREYHNIMIPKAIAYSAGCLDYFFRGKLDVKVWRRPGQHVLRIAVANSFFTGGPLVGGKFELYWDDAAGNRTKITEWANTTLPASDPFNRSLEDYSMWSFNKPPGLTAKSFLVVYKGTINASPTAAADPVDQNIAIAVGRFNPPIGDYEPASVEFSGVLLGPDTTSYPINAVFPLEEWGVLVDIDQFPVILTAYNHRFRSPEFEVSYTYEDNDGETQTRHSTLHLQMRRGFHGGYSGCRSS